MARLDRDLSGLPVPQYNWDTIPEREVRPGLKQKIFRGDNVVIGRTEVHPGADTREHSHDCEQLFMLLEGHVTLELEGQVFDCGPGTVIRIPPNAVHWAKPPKPEDGPALNLDIWYPLRWDYAQFARYQTDVFSPDAPVLEP